ncbi:hypothetical protein GCM10010174_62030 [Kutzneria viridogrisea]|uniref:Uncharacterized protein n=1 Tax=Kutzneria viridogrisea TaxID=47990 RepID=A0ABR6BH28_9PSEU|nr:hypothetical protein [Kutzneria viridogrisea]
MSTDTTALGLLVAATGALVTACTVGTITRRIDRLEVLVREGLDDLSVQVQTLADRDGHSPV